MALASPWPPAGPGCGTGRGHSRHRPCRTAPTGRDNARRPSGLPPRRVAALAEARRPVGPGCGARRQRSRHRTCRTPPTRHDSTRRPSGLPPRRVTAPAGARRPLGPGYGTGRPPGDRPGQRLGRQRPCRTTPTPHNSTRRPSGLPPQPVTALAAARRPLGPGCGIGRSSGPRGLWLPSSLARLFVALLWRRGFGGAPVVRGRYWRGRAWPAAGTGCVAAASGRGRGASAGPDEQGGRGEGGCRAGQGHHGGRCVQGECRGCPGGQGRGHEAEVGWALLAGL
ncbi:hypothetical protein SMALA_2579 [Streptomyces malaysiensis subsp. malaysiensis]|nr:hypothetical protein SMALA_2579 [Streptomyces malaysiensis]